MRRQYPFHLIEPKWQQFWEKQQSFRAFNPGDSVPEGHSFGKRHNLSGKVSAEQLPPKFYILDMFPYPSGAGLHVGHPEGYTATDILARYRRARGFNVLHPMGWDAFGLPAEQYAIKTGQHPRKTTEENIANFKRQIKSLGFSYDWSREVDTTDPKYFKWTQWIFLKLYNSWFNPETNKAEPIETLEFPPTLQDSPPPPPSDGGEGRGEEAKTPLLNPLPTRSSQEEEEDRAAKRRSYRDSKRLAYIAEAPVNWCEELGTVLANEEVINGKSEVGGFPVVRKPMRQWMLRITAYAERLLNDLEGIDWSHSLKEMQRNWIGRSEGAEVDFQIADRAEKIGVFTTRPDTLYGATYIVLSPEHRLVNEITTSEQKAEVEKYKTFAAGKSDLERTELAKEKTGVFTGAYAINPVNGERIPIWIADYVLATYGTGAIMAVPAHDERDFEFAKKFGLPIVQVVLDPEVLAKLKTATRGAILMPLDSPFCDEGIARGSPLDGWGLKDPSGERCNLNGLPTAEAKKKITDWLEAKGLGKKTVNFKLRDWLFSRQRFWGEPFPIIWKRDANGNLYHEALPESALPVVPPELTDYKPAPGGEPPLARAKDWVNLPDGSIRETNTMPQWAGSCWYYLRYLDAQNPQGFVGKDAENYWMGVGSGLRPEKSAKESAHSADTTPGVDLYVGGTEHAVLHLLYARFWHKVLFDLGYVSTPEPFYKLVNQGLILGEMEFYLFQDKNGEPINAAEIIDIEDAAETLIGKEKSSGAKVIARKIDREVEKRGAFFCLKKPDLYIRVEFRCFKMSKSRDNVVNPDDIMGEYGADAFRLYEMFMGPLEMVKPWNTHGVAGVYKFLGRVWRLFVDEKSETEFEQAEATAESQRREELLEKIQLSAAIKNVDATPAQLKTLHACIKKVTEDLDGLRFNTAISAMMVFVNDAIAWETKPVSTLREFLILLQPFAPHLAEELWEKVNIEHPTLNAEHRVALAYANWPKFDPTLLVENEIEIPIQVNGKLRDKIVIAADATQEQLETAALASDKIKPFVEGKTIRKIVVVPKKLVNIVAV